MKEKEAIYKEELTKQNMEGVTDEMLKRASELQKEMHDVISETYKSIPKVKWWQIRKPLPEYQDCVVVYLLMKIARLELKLKEKEELPHKQ